MRELLYPLNPLTGERRKKQNRYLSDLRPRVQESALQKQLRSAWQLGALAERGEVLRRGERAPLQGTPVLFRTAKDRGRVLPPKLLQKPVRVNRFGSQRAEDRSRKVLHIPRHDELRLVAQRQRDDMPIPLIREWQGIGCSGVFRSPGIGKVRAHLTHKVLALGLRHPCVAPQVPHALLQDLIRPEGFVQILDGEVEQEISELEREEDVGVENGNPARHRQ